MSDPYELRADQLESAFSEMGLTVRRVSSRVSRSEYVEVESPDYTASNGEGGKVFKIRVSDHELPQSYAQPDFDVIADRKEHGGVAWNNSGTWLDAVEWLANKIDIAIPAVVRQVRGREATYLRKATEKQQSREMEHIESEMSSFRRLLASIDSGIGVATEKAASGTIFLVANGQRIRSLTRDHRKTLRDAFGLQESSPREDYFRADIQRELDTKQRRLYELKGIAPTPNSHERDSRALEISRMQERPAVRADESGSLEEPAQRTSGAGNKQNITVILNDEQGNELRTFADIKNALERVTTLESLGQLDEALNDLVWRDCDPLRLSHNDVEQWTALVRGKVAVLESPVAKQDDVLFYWEGQQRYEALMAAGRIEEAQDVAGMYNLAYQQELSGFTLKSYAQDYESAQREDAERNAIALVAASSLATQWNAAPAKARHDGRIVAISDTEVIQHIGQGRHVAWQRSQLNGAVVTIGECAQINADGMVVSAPTKGTTLER